MPKPEAACFELSALQRKYAQLEAAMLLGDEAAVSRVQMQLERSGHHVPVTVSDCRATAIKVGTRR